MRILILEDDPERMKYFNRKFFKHSITHVEHSKDAIEKLKSGTFDLICLDHDLGGTQMNFDPEDCGTRVAEFIHKQRLETPVIIHSFNVPAAMRMQRIIPNAKYIPGYWTETVES